MREIFLEAGILAIVIGALWIVAPALSHALYHGNPPAWSTAPW